MKITPSRYAVALAEILEDSKDPKQAIQNFLNLLQRKKAFKLLPKILHAFEEEWNRRKEILSLIISAPQKFASSAETVSKNLEKKSGKKVVLTFNPDNTLIGGLKIRFADLLIDGSVKARLNQFAKSLAL